MNWTLLFFIFLAPAWARRSLSATSLVTCMENSQITPSYFKVSFDADNRALRYNLDLNTDISGKVTAHVQVFAYGFVVIERDIDMCDIGWKQFCPMYPGSMQIESVEYINKDDVNMIPGIAYTVPDIDAVVKVIVINQDTGETVSCLQSSFTNGKTVSQVGIKWATAVIAGLGLLIAAVMSTFGNSNASAHISTNAVSLFMYFQSVVVVSMQHVQRVPPIASAWAENLAWSMGLIRTEFMQKIFRWYVQATGGSPTVYFKNVDKQILVQRAQEFASKKTEHDLDVRDLDFALNSNRNLRVLRGIKRIGYNSHIEPTSIVVTGFTFFVLCGFLLVAVLVFLRSGAVLLIRMKAMNPNRFSHLRKNFSTILKGSLLRYLWIGFPQLVILSLWEFTVQDSPAVIVIAVLFLITAIGIICFSLYQTWRYGKLSIQRHSNPAAVLYGDSKILHKYGFCYTMFRAQKYWFGTVIIGYTLIKGIFIGLCQGSGKASTLVLFILDLAFTIFLFIQKPFLDKSSNIVSYCVAVVTTVNSFLFLFFSELFGQPAQVSSIMGWIFFIMNAAFSLLLLIMILVLICFAMLSRNPDSRFAPAKDDRTSFLRQSSVKRSSRNLRGEDKAANELFALGAAAQDHSDDWENEMHRLNEVETSSISSRSHSRDEKFASVNEISSPAVEVEGDDDEPKKTAVGKFKDKITRKLSTKKNDRNMRLSDTMKEEEDAHINSDSLTNINQHARAGSESGFSQYSTNRPTQGKDIL
ncbi:uncharacterized protein CXQ87_000437 [Candidozyma duobushaemuli]|uniref:ML-like domain-containing protein n=2 Tax=Candidozyma TaxID=3303203 RepID=A0ABX8I2T6_9ASCO|nr:uncharacterized protein CXQ87_000437 [[Candida] duobushaemulonis]PVH17548.1 hypothetical protein CXQ87_000437 [[Candida] duobushaemulonis]QWU86180.1 hypothetical protein CA3LBN_000398 [[Candida] haemuloni]